MTRLYPYRITLCMYSGMTEQHYIEASNYRDAFSKSFRFSVPIAMSGRYGGVQFTNVQKLTRKYCADRNIKFE